MLVDCSSTSVSDVIDALYAVFKARKSISGHAVIVETAMGDVSLPDLSALDIVPDEKGETHEVKNSGIEYFKIKSPDMLGSSQWTVHRNKRAVKVEMLHKGWLDAYHNREIGRASCRERVIVRVVEER